MTEDEELIGRRSAAFPVPITEGDDQGLASQPTAPHPRKVTVAASQDDSVREAEAPAPRGDRPEARPPVSLAEDPRLVAGSSAKAALDDLEAKGLFLVRQPAAQQSQVPARPAAVARPAAPAPAESDWSLFAHKQPVPDAAVPAATAPGPQPMVRPVRRRPDPGFRAADELVDQIEGRVRPERYSDFVRRFERPAEPHQRAVDCLFPPGVVKLFEARAWQKLIEGFQRVIPSAPEEPAAWIGLAVCALAQRDVSTAARLLDHALRLDDELRPYRLLAELLPDHPEDWLRLAEELARLEHLEPAQELCNRVAGDLDRPERLRRRARRAREKLRRVYYHRRGECDPERLVLPVPWTSRALRALGTGLLILGCLALAAAAFVKATTTYHLHRGQTRLAQSTYYLARLQGGDRTADRRAPVEGHLEEALDHFAKVRRWEPSNVRATYLTAVAAEMVVAVGRIRRPKELGWDAARRAAARNAKVRAEADLQSLHLSPQLITAEAQAWESVRQQALQGQGLGY